MIKFNRIKKYQSGGGIPTYQVSPKRPVYTTPMQFLQEGTYQSPAKAAMAKSQGGTKEIEGLPADLKVRDMILNQARALEANMTELDILSNTAIFQEYQRLMNKANDPTFLATIKSNKENYDKFVEVAKDKGTAYVTKENKVLFEGKDQKGNKTYQYLSPSEGVKKGFKPITVSEMVNLRRLDQNFAFNDNVYSDINTSMTLMEINKFLNEQIKSEGYFKDETYLKGKEIAEKAAGEGIAEFKQAVKNNKEARYFMKASLNFLPPQALAQVRLKAAIQAGPNATEQDIEERMLFTLTSVFDKTKINESSTSMVTEGAATKSQGKDKGAKYYAWSQAYQGIGKKSKVPLTYGDGDVSLSITSKPIADWTEGSRFLNISRAFNAATDYNNSYDANGNRISDDTKASALAIDNPHIIFLPVVNGKPFLGKENFKKVETYNNKLEEYQKTMSLESAKRQAAKDAGYDPNMKFERFAATTILSGKKQGVIERWSTPDENEPYTKIDEDSYTYAEYVQAYEQKFGTDLKSGKFPDHAVIKQTIFTPVKGIEEMQIADNILSPGKSDPFIGSVPIGENLYEIQSILDETPLNEIK